MLANGPRRQRGKKILGPSSEFESQLVDFELFVVESGFHAGRAIKKYEYEYEYEHEYEQEYEYEYEYEHE